MIKLQLSNYFNFMNNKKFIALFFLEKLKFEEVRKNRSLIYKFKYDYISAISSRFFKFYFF